MIASLLTTMLFAGNAVFARRSALILGSTTANFWRLLLATMLLGAWSLLFGYGLGAAFGWFLLSGLCGFGLGGLAMFHALPRAGSNLSMLIVQCGSALVALAVEWLWLGARVEPRQFAAVAAVLLGVSLGLAPRSLPGLSRFSLLTGAALAVVSAFGQGIGAVLSRRAFAAVREAGVTIDPASAAYERVLGGVLFATLALVCVRLAGGDRRKLGPQAHIHTPSHAWPWVFANTLAGPVLGVTCFQWALSTTPAGIVQSVVATAPLLTAPVAWRFGESVPRIRYFFGAALAVFGTAALALTR